MAKPWLHGIDAAGEAACEAVAEALAAERLAARRWRDGPVHGPGAVAFDVAGTGVLDLLRDLPASTRVLAIHAGSQPLAADLHWRLLSAGAADVVDFAAMPDVGAAVAAARLARWQLVEAELDTPLVRDNLVGTSAAWRRLLRDVVEFARFSDAGALIVGDSGSGKELLSRLIHTLDARSDKRELVVLDCSTVVDDLAGSEFFGHERGAFTGAAGSRDGAFALADGGTLFLDEIGELPLALQPRLLRVIQERSFKRLGSSRWERTAFRLVCATHRDLSAGVDAGTFRADLFWRISTCCFRVPTLAERREDIEPLARHFLAQARPGRPVPALQGPVLDHLLQRDYPGNVRELRQLMLRIASRHVGDGPLTVGDIPEADRPRDAAQPPPWPRADFESAIRFALARGTGLRDLGQLAAEAAIRIAVDEAGGNLQQAARRLGVTDRALQLRRAAGSLRT